MKLFVCLPSEVDQAIFGSLPFATQTKTVIFLSLGVVNMAATAAVVAMSVCACVLFLLITRKLLPTKRTVCRHHYLFQCNGLA